MQQLRQEENLGRFAAMLSRREVLQRATVLGLGALVVSALPAAERIFVSEADAALQLTDATLQAFADTMLPGRPALTTDLGNEIHPLAIAGVDNEPGAVEADALLLYHDALIGFDALEVPFLAELSARSLVHGGPFLDLAFAQRVAVCIEGLAPEQSQRPRVGSGRGRAVHRVPRGRRAERGHDRHLVRLPGDGLSGHGAERLRGILLQAQARERTDEEGLPALDAMAERFDVCIVGSGFGGSISAFRLAELYRAAGETPSIVVLDHGPRHQHTDFRQSMDVENLSRIYGLIQGEGAQIVVGNGVGGGSNFYLAASLRSPTETFERRDHRPDDGPDRRMWPVEVSRTTLDPFYARAEQALRVQRPTWKQVAKSGGLWAATLDRAGHTCDRVPLAIDLNRCIQAKWCHTGCIYGAKNSVITNYLASAEEMGVEVRPEHRGRADRSEPGAALPLRRHVVGTRQRRSRTRRVSPPDAPPKSNARC